MQYFLPTPADVLEDIEKAAKIAENIVAANKRVGPSKRMPARWEENQIAYANGLRRAAEILQIHIDTLAVLANDTDGSYHKLLGIKE